MEKLSFRRICAFAIIVSALCLTTLISYASTRAGTVIANDVKLLRGMNFESDVLGNLERGQGVIIQEENFDWVKVKLDGENREGWVCKDFVLTKKNEETSVRKGRTTASVLNVRAGASTSHTILTKVNRGTEIIIIGAEAEWYQIMLDQGQKAWVHSDFVDIIPNYPKGILLENSVPYFLERNLENQKQIGHLTKTDNIYIKDYQEGWYLVELENSSQGWVQEKHIDVYSNVINSISRSSSRNNSLGNIKEITSKYLGKSYRLGSAGPNQFDCSGFVHYILNSYYSEYLKSKNITLPRSSRDQAIVGTNVETNNLQVGDLLFFNTTRTRGSNVTHAGIYIGNGDFIHASSTGEGVVISTISEGYYLNRLLSARRL